MTFKHVLHRDYETRSIVDLKKTGVYVYAQDADTSVWCCAFARDDEPADLWFPGDPCPPEFKEAAANPEWEVAAFNDNFEAQIEQYIMSVRFGWPVIPIERHRCIMAQCMAMALPGNLEDAAAALRSPILKDAAGARLMKKMMKARKILADGTIIWWDEPENIQRLGAYCVTDVEAEREVDKRTFRLSPAEQRLWILDQRINARGVYVDKPLCEATIDVVDKIKEQLDREMAAVTEHGVTGCTNRNQMVGWLRDKGLDVESIAKDQVDEMLARGDLKPNVRRALELRREGAKVSVAKVDALLNGLSDDGRNKGLLQFHAASTGRWGGRRFQPQNLKRPELKDFDTIIGALMTRDAGYFTTMYDRPMAAIGDAIRPMVTAAPGKILMTGDFANIEGRVAAWLAGEQWKVQAFRDYDTIIGKDEKGKPLRAGPDLYKLAYSRSFGTPIDKIEDKQRQVGKVQELALQYQGGHGAFVTMAATYNVKISDLMNIVAKTVDDKIWDDAYDRFTPLTSFGMDRNEWTALRIVIDAWRKAHPNIKQSWRDCEDACIAAVEHPGEAYSVGPLRFKKSGSFLWMRLPSGRTLCYPYPGVVWKEMPWDDKDPVWKPCDSLERAIFLYGDKLVRYDALNGQALVYVPAQKKTLTYKGVDSFSHQWVSQFAYGGLIFQNAVQAIARDCLAESIVRLEEAGYPVVLHVHDEDVSEVDEDFGSIEEFMGIMATPPEWIGDCPIAVDGHAGKRYKKG